MQFRWCLSQCCGLIGASVFSERRDVCGSHCSSLTHNTHIHTPSCRSKQFDVHRWMQNEHLSNSLTHRKTAVFMCVHIGLCFSEPFRITVIMCYFWSVNACVWCTVFPGAFWENLQCICIQFKSWYLVCSHAFIPFFWLLHALWVFDTLADKSTMFLAQSDDAMVSVFK